MLKKLTLLAMAVGALMVFAGPAQAIELTDESGNKVPTGEFITAISEDSETKSGPNTLQCDVVGITGEVETNGPSTVTIGNITVTTEPTPCNFNGNPLIHIVAKISSIHLESGTKGTATGVTFTQLITGPGITCHFSNEALPLGYTSTAITVGGAGNNLAGGAPCGPGELTASFSLTSDDHSETWELDH